MGQAIDPARQERELSKQALAERVEQFEERLHHELDWRARLRRNRGRLLVVAAGGATLIAVAVIVRLNAGGRGRDGEPATLDDITQELHQIRKQLERRQGEAPMWQRLVIRSAVAAATAGGAYAARKMVQGAQTKQEDGDSARTG